MNVEGGILEWNWRGGVKLKRTVWKNLDKEMY